MQITTRRGASAAPVAVASITAVPIAQSAAARDYHGADAELLRLWQDYEAAHREGSRFDDLAEDAHACGLTDEWKRLEHESDEQTLRCGEISDQIMSTPAQGFAGLVVRQRILAINAICEGSSDRELFVLAVLRELERMAGMSHTTVVAPISQMP